MTINNYDLITPMLDFQSEDDYYMLQVIKRRKENPDMEVGERVLRTVYVTSLEKLNKLWNDLITLAEQNNARVYINMNVKSMKKTSMLAMKELAGRVMDDNFKGAYHIFDSAAGQCGATREKKWIVDLDYDPKTFKMRYSDYIDAAKKAINNCQPEGDKVLGVIPTLNGCHLITSPFNVCDFNKAMIGEDLCVPDVHKNNPTLLYYDNCSKTYDINVKIDGKDVTLNFDKDDVANSFTAQFPFMKRNERK